MSRAPIPSDAELTKEINILQAREWLLLLNAPLAPGECLRRAKSLSITQQQTRTLLSNLDTATVPQSLLDRYLNYRTFTKGSILSTLRGVPDLGLRHAYLSEVSKGAADYVAKINAAKDNVEQARQLAKEAVALRNRTRDMFRAKYARESSKLVSDGWKSIKGGAYDLLQWQNKDKRSVNYLIEQLAGSKEAYEKLPDPEKIKVLSRVAKGSGKGGSLSTLTKAFDGIVRPLQLTVDVLLIANDAREARDPYRVVASGALRLGAAVAVGTATEAATLAVVGALSLSTGVGAVVFFAGTFIANQYLNEWVNSTVMGIYDDFNPRTPEVLRDVSWEPVSFNTSMQEALPSLTMLEELKTSMMEAS